MWYNPLSIKAFHEQYPDLTPRIKQWTPFSYDYWFRGIEIGDFVVSKREDTLSLDRTVFKVIAIGGDSIFKPQILLERPSNRRKGSGGVANRYGYGRNEDDESVCRRIYAAYNCLIVEPDPAAPWTRILPVKQKEGEENVCKNNCRRGYCYCDEPMEVSVDVHDMIVTITKNNREIRLNVEEATSLYNRLSTVKPEIKEARSKMLEEQISELKSQLDSLQSL